MPRSARTNRIRGPQPHPGADRPVGHRRRLRAALAAGVSAVVLAGCQSSGDRSRSAVLIVGDSLITQARGAIGAFQPDSVRFTVEDGLGSAPCDWLHGYHDPYANRFNSYRNALARSAFRYVVLMFSGNPGLSGPSAGCVGAAGPYAVDQLVSSYRRALLAMAEMASAAHAEVIFERPPPRNPSAPAGYRSSTRSDAGYQGEPAVTALYAALPSDAPSGGRWRVGTAAAAAVSGPGWSYRLTLACSYLTEPGCSNGRVRVRAGGSDAIHFDRAGCGAMLFAVGIDADLVGMDNLNPQLATDRSRYGGCRGETG